MPAAAISHTNWQVNRAHDFFGLVARLHTKLAAHTTICIYINRLCGNPEPLRLEALLAQAPSRF